MHSRNNFVNKTLLQLGGIAEFNPDLIGRGIREALIRNSTTYPGSDLSSGPRFQARSSVRRGTNSSEGRDDALGNDTK